MALWISDLEVKGSRAGCLYLTNTGDCFGSEGPPRAQCHLQELMGTSGSASSPASGHAVKPLRLQRALRNTERCTWSADSGS